jgi:hypothetical protein
MIGMLAGRFWAIIRAKGMTVWPWAYLPLWITPNKLYLLNALEIVGLLASFALTAFWFGFMLAVPAAILFFPVKHLLVARWMREWFARNARDDSEREVLDLFDGPGR